MIPSAPPQRRRLSLVGVALALAGTAACTEVSVPDARPTRISLEVEQAQRQVGQDFTFTYAGEGSSILGVLLLYGDGTVDSIPAFGAQTVGGRRDHAYDAPGNYRVTVLMEDAGRPMAEAGVDVVVVPRP